MDLVYPTRAGYRHGIDPLRWALRSAEQHLDVGRVFIVGDLPRWIDPATVEHIPTLQDRSKFENIGRNVAAIAEHGPAEFVWSNDDIFVLQDLSEIPLYHRHRPFREVVERLNGDTGSAEHRAFVLGMRQQLELLERWGHIDPWCTDMHVPITIRRARLRRILAKRDAEMPEIEGGHFRALYGGGLASIPLQDVKRRGARPTLPAGEMFISTDPVSWKQGPLGRWIRSRYWRPSRWERTR